MRKQSLWESVREFLGFGRRETPRGLQALKCRTLHLEPLEQRQLLTVLYWDPDLNSANNNYSTGAGLGGSGTSNWSTTNAWVDSNGTRYTWNSGRSGDEAYFRGTAGTVTVDSAISAAKLNFLDADGYTLGSGSTLTLTGSGGTSINAGQSAAINAAVSVTTADQTWTVASGKTLSLGGSVSFASRALTINGTGTANFTGSVSGGSLAAVDWTTATFSGSSSLTTTSFTEVRGNGTINWNSSGTLSPTCLYVGYSGWAGTLTQISGTVAVNNANGVSISSTQSPGTKSTYNLDGGVLQTHVMVADSSSDTVFDFGGGTLQAAGGNLTPSTALQYTATAGTTSIIDTNGYNITLGGPISGSGNLTKQTGSGTLTLSGSNGSYTGTTTVSNGVLKAGSATALGGSGASVVITNADNGYLDLNGQSIGSGVSVSMKSIATGTSAIQNSSATAAAMAGNITLTGGAYVGMGSGQITLSGNITDNGNGYFLCNYAATSLVVLSGNNSFGRLAVWGSGGFRLDSDTALAATTSVDFSAIGVLNVNGHTITIGSFLSASGGGTGTVQLGSGTLIFGDSTSQTFAGVISGAGAVTKQGTGTETFTGANTYTGGTTVNADTGTLLLSGGNNRLATTGNITIASGVFDLGGNTQATSGTVTFQGGTTQNGTLSTSNLFAAYAGLVSANLGGSAILAVSKTTSDTLTLTGTNSYTGITAISGGTICFGSGAFNGGGSIVFYSDSTLQWAAGNTNDISSRLYINDGVHATLDTNGNTVMFATGMSGSPSGSSTGSLTKTGSGTLTLSGANTYTGGTTVNEGTLALSGGSNRLSTGGAITAVVGGTLDLGGNGQSTSGAVSFQGGTVQNGTLTETGATAYDAQAGTVSAALAGSVGLTKTTAGTLTLSGANTYTGTTTVSVGTLQESGGSNRLPTGTAVSLANASGAVLDLNGQNQTVASLSGGGASGGNVTLGAGTLTVGDSSSTTFAGVLSGTGGSLVKQGSGTLTLSGANTYTGTTTVSVGTLQESGGSNRLPTGTAVSLANASGAVLDLNGQNQTVASLSGGGASGGNVTLGAGTLTVGDSSSTTFAGVLSGTGGSLVKQGSGTLTLSGANTYTGTTTVSVGTLQESGGSNRLPTGTAVSLANASGAVLDLNGQNQTVASLSGGGASGGNVTLGAGTLTVGDSSSTTFAGVLSGTGGSLVKQGSGTLTLSGANTYTGTTTVSVGTLQESGGSNRLPTGTAVSLANASGAVLDLNGQNQTVASLSGGGASGGNVTLGAGTLTVGDSSSTTFAGVLSGTGGSLVKQGSGTLTLSGANTYTGTTTVSVGTLQESGGSNRLPTGTAVSLANASGAVLDLNGQNQTVASLSGGGASGGNVTLGAGTLTVGDSSSTTFAGVLSGTGGSLVKQGSGTLTLSGANTYTGTTTVSVGTLQESGGSNRLPTGTAVSLANASGAVLDLNGQNQTVASLSGGGASGGNVTLGAGTLTVGDSSSTTFAGVLSGTGGSLVKQGSGTLTLSGANTYTGTTTVSVGTLQESGGSNRLPTGTAVSLANASGAVLDLNGQNQTVASLSGGGASGGNVTLGAGTLTVGDSSSTTFAGVLSGTGGSLVKQGSGTLTLSGANTYTGTTTVSVGTLQESGGSNRLPTGTAVSLANASGAVLDLNGQNQTVASLSGGGASGGNVTLGAGTLTVGDSSSTTFAGVLSGTGGSLVKQGSGTLTLSGANTYTGTTTVSVGTLQVGAGGTAGTLGTGSVTDSSALVFNRSDSLTEGSAISGTGTLTQQGTGTLILTGANTYSGTTTISQGTISVSNIVVSGGGSNLGNATSAVVLGDATHQGVLSYTDSTATYTRGFTVNAGGGEIDVTTAGQTLTIGTNGVSGSGSLTIGGAGSTLMSAANSYSGNTIISAGTLQVGNVSAIPSGTGKGNVTVNGTLDLNGNSITINGLSGSGTVTSGVAGSVTLTVGANDQTSTFWGVVQNGSGTVGLTKIGSGTLTLATNQTYSGPTTVEAGTLNVLGNLNSDVTLAGGAVTGLVFYDHDLAAAVREALGMSADTVLTTSNVAALTSLSADSNRISTLEGLEYATNLESLTLVPGDFSTTLETLSSLSPLAGLAHLKTLALEHCGLTNAVLAASVNLPAVQSLDLRYNSIGAIPSWIAGLSNLTSLLVYGNSTLTDNPRAGLTNLAGKLINVDIAPDHPEKATTIADLAASLYYLPIEMYEYVVNTIEFQPYAGAMKGALAVLQTGAGNDWDTDSLLVGLFAAIPGVSITTNYVSGQISISDETAENYVGVTDASAALAVLNAAGLNATTGTGTIIFDHAWLEATICGTTFELDPSWKFRDFQPGMGDMLDVDKVPFDANPAHGNRIGDYLSDVRSETAAEYYEQQVRDYLANPANGLTDKTSADVSYDGPIHPQVIASLPTTLPYTVSSSTNDHSTIPDAKMHKVQLQLYAGGTQLFTYSANIADISLSRLSIYPYTDPYHPGETLPVLLLDDQVEEVSAAWISPANGDITLTITHLFGSTTVGTPQSYDRPADQYIVIGLDANQISDQMITGIRSSLNDAEITTLNTLTYDPEAVIGGLLQLAAVTYFHDCDQSREAIAGLTGAVPVYNQVASGITSSDASVWNDANDPNQQIPFVPSRMLIDVKNGSWGTIAIQSSDQSAVARSNLIGYTSSALESGVWEELTNVPSESTIESLQYAHENSISVVTIDQNNIGQIATLLSNLSQGIRDGISSYVTSGNKVTVPNGYTYTSDPDLKDPYGNQYRFVGYTVTDSSGYTNAFLLASDTGTFWTGGGADADLSGGLAYQLPEPVTTIVSADASLLVSDPVNAADGDVVHQETDFSIPNLGVPLDFARQYDSFNTVSGIAGAPSPWSDRGMGEGWSFSFSDQLLSSGTSVTWFTADGILNTFTCKDVALNGDTEYNNPTGLFGTFVHLAGNNGYLWTDTTGNVMMFDESGKLLSEYDRYGNGVDVAYDVSGHITTVSDHVTPARCLTFSYTGSDITAVTDFNGRTWTYSYTNGRLTSVTANYSSPGVYDPDYPDQNVKTSYTYYTDPALAGLLETVTDADNNTTTYEYYANRRGFKVTDPEGGVYSLSYNLFRQQTAATCKLGSTGYYSYEVDGGIAYLTERLYADQTTNTYQWSGGLLTSDTDAYGQTETYTYYNDGTGDLHTYTDQASNVTTYTYIGDIQDRNLNIASITAPGPNGNVVTTFTYNANSGKSLTDITEDSGGLNIQSTFTYQGTYGARGLPDSMTTPNGYTSTYTYNAAGQVLTDTYPVSSTHSITEQYGYDSRGNLTSYTDGDGNLTSYTYDLLDRVKTETDPDPDGTGYGLPAPSITYTYDAAGNLLSETDDTVLADPRITTYTYDALDQATSVTNPDGTYTTYDYDQGGNQVFQTDELGRLTQYVYDQRYRLIDTIQPDGGVLRTTYDGGNRVVAETDALGNTTQYEYDLLGQLTEVVSPDPDGAGTLTSLITLYGYDAAGNLQYVTNTYAVDSDNTPAVSLGNPDHSTQYVYDSLGRVTEEIDAKPDANTAGPTTYYGYDNDGNLKWVTDARGSAAQDPDHTTTYDYDQADRLIHVNVPDPNGSTGEKLTTRYFYDDDGNVTDVVDPRGTDAKEAAYTTHYVYDNLGRLTEEVDPDPDDFSHAGGSNGPETRPTTTYAYDAYGNLATVTDPMGYHTTYQYDKLGQCTAVTDPLGNTSSVLYDAVGNVLLATDALGAVTSYQYDSMDQVVQVTQPAPDANTPAPVTYYGYDADGNLAWSTDPEGSGPQDPDHTTTYAYDNLGRQILVTGPDTGSNTPATSYAYDALGNLHSVTDGLALGHATTYAYDNLGRLTSQTDALSGVTSYTYDPNGNTLSVEDPDGNTTQYAYDSLNRLTSETDQLADTRYYQYDAVGDLTQYTDRDGRVTQYQYDNLGRETAENWLDSNQNVIHTFSYGYDADGDLLVASDPAAWYSYAYNDDGQLATETQTIAGLTPVVMLSRQYDAVGDLTQLAASLDSTGDFVNDYLHNWLGEVTSIEQHGVVGGDSIAEKRVDFTYNALGQFSTIARYSALAGGSGNEVATSTYGYDNAGRLTSLTDTHGTTTLAGYQFQYDAADNLTEMKSSADATTGNSWGVVDYTYDHTNQLQTATYTTFANAPANENYGYDANGNQDTSGNTVQPTGDNRLATDAAGYTYFYDAEGNRTAKFIGTPTDDHTIPSDATDITIYHWDYRNRLTEVDHFTTYANYNAGTSNLIVTYAYDFANRLVKEVVDSDGTSGSTPVQQTAYAYDGMNAVLQFEKTGTGDVAASNLSDRYLWGAAVDQILADEQVTSLGTPGTPLWGLADHEGTIRDIVNNSGSVIDHRVFDSFGKMTNETVPATDFVFGYTGKLFDRATGLQNNLNRWYDATVGSFVNQDPLGLMAGPNPYSYCGNSPTAFIDPSGLKNWPADEADQAVPGDTISTPEGTVTVGTSSGRTILIYVMKDSNGVLHYGWVIDGHFRPIVGVYCPNEPPIEGAAIPDDYQRYAIDSAGEGNVVRVTDLNNPVRNADSQLKNGIYMLIIFDHSSSVSYQAMAQHELSNDELKTLAAHVVKGGVIVLGGCAVGGEERYLKTAAQVTGRRVRACPGFTMGVRAVEEKVDEKGTKFWSVIEDMYWTEYDPDHPEGVYYYARGNSRHPSYAAFEDAKKPGTGTFVRYKPNSRRVDATYKYTTTSNGTIVIRDSKTNELIMIRQPDGRIRKASDLSDDERSAYAQTNSLQSGSAY